MSQPSRSGRDVAPPPQRRADDAELTDTRLETLLATMWELARDHGLTVTEAADVCETSWLRLADRLAARSEDPGSIDDTVVAIATEETRRAVALRRWHERRLAAFDRPDDRPGQGDER